MQMQSWLWNNIFRLSGVDESILRKRVIVSVFLLLGIGMIFVFCASGIYALKTFNDPYYYLKRHSVFLLISILFVLIFMGIGLDNVKKSARAAVIISIALLVLVLIFGNSGGGAKRWFSFGPINIQPSFLAHLSLIIYLPYYIEKFYIKNGFYPGRTLRGMGPPFLVTLVMSSLIVVEPDLGNAAMCFFLLLAVFWVAGLRKRYLAALFIILAAAGTFFIITSPFRLNRIIAFLDPWQDPQNKGYQLVQAFIALGSGGLFGAGLAMGKQRLLYLPASHTDFLFSIIGEDLGFVGLSIILLLFFYLYIQCFAIALTRRDIFRRMLAVACFSYLLFLTIINVFVNVGLIPTKGLPLPFISYGGTSLLVNMIIVGLILMTSKGDDLLKGKARVVG